MKPRKGAIGPFAGLRTSAGGDGGADGAGDNAALALAAHGLAATIYDDPRAAAFADGDGLVLCGDALVDRFDARLLLAESGASFQQRAPRAHAATSSNDDADEALIQAERYRYLDPSKEHLLQSALPPSFGDAGGAGACERREAAAPAAARRPCGFDCAALTPFASATRIASTGLP